LWAVVGLGNPGRRYSRTRHNVGFIFVKRVAREWKVKLRKKMFFSKAVEVERKKEKILLAIPQTYFLWERLGLEKEEDLEPIKG